MYNCITEPTERVKAVTSGVYSRVSAYCDWIQQTTKGDVRCR